MSLESDLSTLNIAAFGGFQVSMPCGRAIPLPGQKDRALLGFLALSPGVTHAREKLAGLLWSDSGDRQARDSLKQALLRLRRSFDGFLGDPLITDRQSVMLDPDSVSVDVSRFEELLRERGPGAIELATSLYGGDLLEGVMVRDATFEDWLQVERQRLRTMAAEACTDLMTRSLDDGRRDRAAGAARQLLSLDPLNEAACRTLMRVQSERKERTQALKLFETLRCRLQQELGVAPEPETIALYREIRSRRAADMSSGTEAAPAEDGIAQASATKVTQMADWPVATERAKPTIAVLPFSIIGGDPEQEYFADGLTEDIITDLAQVSGLFVASRHSAFMYKGKQISVQRAARELNVRCILEGSVRAAAGRVRITTQLVDGETGGQLWARRYDRSLDDIFALQDEIANSIVNVLKVKLLPDELACITSHSTKSVDAYQHFLMGRSFYLRGMDRHSQSIARKMFHKAIEIDPGYARAYAALASCESYLSMSDPSVTNESCIANSLRALELDPNLAEAHAARGLVLYATGRFAEATPEFELALSLGPDLYETHFMAARNCRLQGFHQRAATLFEKAAALRPRDYRSLGLLATQYKALGRLDDFVSTARHCLACIEEAIEAHPDNADALSFGSALLAQLGQSGRAGTWVERAIMIAPDTPIVRYNASITQLNLDRPDRALEFLERAFQSTPEWQRRLARWMAHDRDIDPLRDHPRFRALLQWLEIDCLSVNGAVAAE